MKINVIFSLFTLLALCSCGRIKDETIHTIRLSIQNHSVASVFFTINKNRNQKYVESADSIDFTPIKPGQTLQLDFHFVPGTYTVFPIDNPESTEGQIELDFKVYDENKIELSDRWRKKNYDRNPSTKWTNYYYDVSYKTKYSKGEYESIINRISDDGDKQEFSSHYFLESSGENYKINSSSADIQVSNLEIWDHKYFIPIFGKYGIPIARNLLIVDEWNWLEN